MFHSNQKFCVSCDDKQLKNVISLILEMHKVLDKPQKLAYQITQNSIAIGQYYNDVEPGWNKFMFENPSIEMVLAAVKQFTHDHPSHEYEEGDGSSHPGYLVECVEKSFADEKNGIKKPWYGIFTVTAYNCYYSK